MNGDVTVGADGSFVEPGRSPGTEAQMKLRDDGVAGIAELAHLLVGEHVSVRAAVWLVARTASIHPRGAVLEHERTLGVGVAFGADPLAESAKMPRACRRVRIVARRAGNAALLESMALVEGELAEGLLVTLEAGGRGRIHAIEPCGQPDLRGS